MAKLKGGLGKGLDALFFASNVPVDTIIADSGVKLQDIELNKIKPGKYQPRRVFDESELQELADSISHNGVIQPIVIRKIGNGYELIAGERRWRASKIAGLDKIPAIIRSLTDEEALAIALIENIQRKDLNIIEESHGYKRLIDEFKLTHEELAKITGRSRSHISNILRLLNLVDAVQDMVLNNKLDMGHARALLPLSEDLQLPVAEKVVAENLTTGEVERYVASFLLQNDEVDDVDGISYPLSSFMNVRKDPDITRLETTLADKIGMLVSIKHSKKGNGKLTIAYESLDELDNLLQYLK